MIARLYEAVTGTPWTTGRSAAAEFGPTVATRYADALSWLTDAELMAMTPAQAAAYGQAMAAARTDIERVEIFEAFDLVS
ncbi:hypothetical protein QEZ54_35385 [Catellatospora sp. KI3]|uniref:hypothetical protein n=1 Tax=Catellatospora sp. KI3 TaxID=3041620 RepID=UPI0024824A9A|nr:hypothetical protein [Catellatospora sp. KI3]MDI1466274.1 hypothetical protein [Catellatospora sp. KI3]